MPTNRPSNFPEYPTIESVLEELQPLLETLTDACSEGTIHVGKYAESENEPIDYTLAPNLVRHKIKRYLTVRGQNATNEEEEPNFTTDGIPNNGICIKVSGFVVRVLKSADDGSVPSPGDSLPRQNFYNQRQALLDFEEFRNGNEHVQPTWGVIVHWFVDGEYNLLRLSIALPTSAGTKASPKPECFFDEPFWTRPPQVNVTPIDSLQQPPDLDVKGIEEETEEKTGEEPENE
jgi:hypothetical protein